MLASSEYCLCCGTTQPASQFTITPAKPLPLCSSCAALTPYASAVQARSTTINELRALESSRAHRKQMRVSKRIEAYKATGGKRCHSCHALKPVEAYGLCSTRPDALQAECKACISLRGAMLKDHIHGRASWLTVRDALREKNKV